MAANIVNVIQGISFNSSIQIKGSYNLKHLMRHTNIHNMNMKIVYAEKNVLKSTQVTARFYKGHLNHYSQNAHLSGTI